MSSEHSKLLRGFVVLLVINAVITAGHFIALLSTGFGDQALVREFALADTVGSVVPSLIAAAGLWRMRLWGIFFAALAVGSYTHGMLVLLARALEPGAAGMMPFVAVYFLAFSWALLLVVWRERRRFAPDFARHESIA